MNHWTIHSILIITHTLIREIPALGNLYNGLHMIVFKIVIKLF